MKKLSFLLKTMFVSLLLVSCNTDNNSTVPSDGSSSETHSSTSGVESSETSSSNTSVEPVKDPLSVKEVLEKEDLEEVEFVGYIIGHDLGNRHIIIEDKDDPRYSIQLYKNPGYFATRVGDEVLVKGYRTYDRDVDRIAPTDLEILSRDNVTSYDDPIVINGADLYEWTSENRMNPDILFKVYKFENVLITSATTSYTYIDDKYDEVGGRGLKIGIKNDSSVYGSENFVVGQRYTFTAILYGPSDSFFDDTRDGLVLRLSVMREEDVEVLIDGEDAAILFTGKRAYLKQAENIEIDFTELFSVTDQVDGKIAVTEDMISGSVDLTVDGVYPITIKYTNSKGHRTSRTINYYVTETGMTVTEALEEENELDLIVNAVVLGFAINSSNKKSGLIFHDPLTGKAIETWAPHQNGRLDDLKVGDKVLLYVGKLTVEKGLPRFLNVEVLKLISENNALAAPKEIENIEEWSNGLPNTPKDVFGRYTFTAKMVEVGNTYNYFYRDTNNKVQIAIHKESAVSYDFVVGTTYKITAIIYGISDPFSALSTKSMVLRMGIMDINDVKVVEEVEPTEPVDPDPVTYLSVTEVIGKEVGEAVEFTGVVLGYGKKNVTTNEKTAIIIGDPDNGNAVEIWLNKSVAGFDDLLVGDKVRISGERGVEKGYPRIKNYKLEEVISSNNPLPATREVTDLMEMSNCIVSDVVNSLGRYHFTATVQKTGSYVHFLLGPEAGTDVEFILQISIHQDSSTYKFDFELGKTYEITATLIGMSDALTAIANKNISTRLSIMSATDVIEVQ